LNLYNQKQVIYLISSPLVERDFVRYGIKKWINYGWKVKVFDFTKFLFPGFWKYVNGDKFSVNFEGLTIFQNVNEVLLILNNLQNKVIFIDNIGFSSLEQRIRKAAYDHGVLVRIKIGSIPEPKYKKNIPNFYLLIKNPIILIDKIIFFIKKKIEKNRAERYFPNYCVVGGIKSISGINQKKTSIIKAHNRAYDFFINKKHAKSNKKEKFLVFLDEDAPYASDYVRLGIRPYVTVDKYFPVINLGLSKIAKSLNLKIKIAAHPRSNFEIMKKKYNHPIFENKTFALIRDADVVVSHSSTALEWAVIMKKPIIFVTTDEIQNAFYAKSYAQSVDSFATVLGKKVVNFSHLSSINNWKDYLNIDDEKYEKYIENYVKTKESPKKLVWDIVIEYIEKDLFL
jgi:hypothetical protein